MPRLTMISGSRPGLTTNLKASFVWVPRNGNANGNQFLNSTHPIPPSIGSKGFNQSMSERRNILITGATGFLGSHLAARFLQDGCHVTALFRGSQNSLPRTRVVNVMGDDGVS